MLGAFAKPRKPAKLRAIPAPRSEELLFYRDIRTIVRDAEAVVRAIVLPALPQLLATSGMPRADDLGDDLTRLFDRVKGALRGVDVDARKAAVTMLERVQRKHAVAFDAAYGAVLPAIDPMAGEPWLAGAMKVAVTENAALITSLPANMVAEVQGIVSRGVVAGSRAEAMAADIVARFGVAESRAALIASDQVLKWHGSLQKNRQLDAGVSEYTWSTSADERVRPGHRALNGSKQAWGKPPVDDPRTGARHDPGMAVRCRCCAIPVVPEID